MTTKGGEGNEEIDKNIDLSVYDGIDLGGYRENQNYNFIREVRYRLGLMGRGMPMSGVPFSFSIHCRTVWGKRRDTRVPVRKLLRKE